MNARREDVYALSDEGLAQMLVELHAQAQPHLHLSKWDVEFMRDAPEMFVARGWTWKQRHHARRILLQTFEKLRCMDAVFGR